MRFLRQTARGPLVQALPADSLEPGVLTRLQRWTLENIGRTAGRFLTAKRKVHIQEWMINRFRIPVDWQPREKLQACLEGHLAWLVEQQEHAADLGDYLEFGVYQGNSLICMSRAVEAAGVHHVRLFGFDSFEGLPDSAGFDKVWSKGQFRSELDFTRALLDEAGVDWDRVELVKGFYDQVLDDELAKRVELHKASVVMIDCDLYTSTRDALEFCEPRLADHAVILFDDWFSTDEDHGEQLAFREFLDRHPGYRAEAQGGYHDGAEVFRIERIPTDPQG
jgi:predicted O-methyltransferase YrrM